MFWGSPVFMVQKRWSFLYHKNSFFILTGNSGQIKKQSVQDRTLIRKEKRVVYRGDKNGAAGAGDDRHWLAVQ